MNKPTASVRLPREVVDALAFAATTALRELTQVEAWPEETSQTHNVASTEPVMSALVRLQRPLPGTMTLVLPQDTASRLAARYLPEGTALTEDIIVDVVGELANVIAGQAKTILKRTPYHFTLTPPVVTSANSFAELPGLSPTTLAVSLAFEASRLWLFVDLQPCPGA